MIVPILWAASYVREQLMKKSIVKGLLGISVLALVSSWVVLVSAAPKVIDIEPEECQTRCYYIMGVPIICYEICFLGQSRRSLELRRQSVRRRSGTGCQWAHPDDVGPSGTSRPGNPLGPRCARLWMTRARDELGPFPCGIVEKRRIFIWGDPLVRIFAGKYESLLVLVPIGSTDRALKG
jgi:hypothetical protein